MRIADSGTRAYPYTTLVEPSTTPVDLATVKSYLKIPASQASQDTILQLFIDAATGLAEECTGLCLINRTLRTFRDFFPDYTSEGYYIDGYLPQSFNQFPGNTSIELRRSNATSIVAFEFLDLTTTFVAVDPAIFYFVDAEPGKFAQVALSLEQFWPFDLVTPRMNSIRLDFVCGYGDTSADVPAAIRAAILTHISFMYANRGDCGEANYTKFVPPTVTLVYSKYKVRSL